MLKKVIHDWDDDRALSILRNCRRAIPSAGRLLLIEPVIPPGNGPSFNKLLDLLMLVWTPRRQGAHRSRASDPTRVSGIQVSSDIRRPHR